ncbi:MAG TPA: hypothetical protein VFP34_14260 [Microlunatus sp.]|nr:hypothetical protein [Microlunatus sp.]
MSTTPAGSAMWFSEVVIMTMSLLAFDETARRLQLARRIDVGVRAIPVGRIVGSVGRSRDLDRDFRGPWALAPTRLRSLRDAFPDSTGPAIDVFEVGGIYFVEDGHHRVALARERHNEFIDAHVTRLETDYSVGPDVDVAQLLHTEQQRLLLDETGLDRFRPDATIEFTLLDGYTQTRDIIKAHGYDLARRRGVLPEVEEIGSDWYDTVYLEAVAAARRAGLPALYASWNSTDGDFFLWLYQIRRDLRASDAGADFDAAAERARSLHLGRRQRRNHLRNGRRPLRRICRAPRPSTA